MHTIRQIQFCQDKGVMPTPTNPKQQERKKNVRHTIMVISLFKMQYFYFKKPKQNKL